MLLPNRHGLWFRLLLMVGAAVLFLAGYQWGNQSQRRLDPLPAIGGVLLQPPGAIPAFRLRDPLGREFDQGTLASGWTLLTFGNLTAADGQLAIQRLIEVYNRVADQRDLQRALRLVLVSGETGTDLARDYARLSPALFVLSGEAEEVGRLRAALGVRGDEPDPAAMAEPLRVPPYKEYDGRQAEPLRVPPYKEYDGRQAEPLRVPPYKEYDGRQAEPLRVPPDEGQDRRQDHQDRGDEASPLYVIAPGGFLLALFTHAGDGARTAADLTALHDHLDQLLPEGQ